MTLNEEFRIIKPMKRPPARVWLTAVVLGCALIVSGCGGGVGGGGGSTNPLTKPTKGGPGSFDEKSTMAAIQKRGKLIVATTFDAKPFAYNDSSTGSPGGIDVALVKDIATGIFGSQIEGRIQWVTYTPGEFDLAVRNGNVDLAIGRYEITVPRKQFIDFAGPYYVSHQGAIVSKQRRVRTGEQITSLAQLNGKRVCTVRTSTDFEELKRVLPSAKLSDPLETVEQCGAQLLAGETDGIVADAVDEVPFINSSGGDVGVLEPTIGSVAYGVGVKQSAKDFRQYINDRIENWKAFKDVSAAEIGKGVPGGINKPAVDRY